MTPSEQIKLLREALMSLRKSHYECEDCYYSCPKCAEGCCNESIDKDFCTCGADEHNLRIDEAIAAIEATPVADGQDADWETEAMRAEVQRRNAAPVPHDAVVPGEPVELADCPIGLFVSSDGSLSLKTEYGNNEGRIDAYIVESGEFFWGENPQTIENQRKQLVRPVTLESASAVRDRALEEAAQLCEAVIGDGGSEWSKGYDVAGRHLADAIRALKVKP